MNKADRIVAEELKRLRWTQQDLMRYLFALFGLVLRFEGEEH